MNDNPCFRYMCRGFCIALCFIILSSLTTFSVHFASVVGQPLFEGLEPFVVNIFCAALYPFVFNSIAITFAYSDRFAIEEFLSREDESISLRKEIKYLFSSASFLTEFFTVVLIIAFCAAIGLFSPIGGMFKPSMPRDGWFPTLLLTPVCILSLVFSKYEAVRYFAKLKENNDMEKLLSPKWLPIRILILSLLYPFCAPMTPVAVFAVISIFSVFAKISAILTVLGFALAVVALIFIIRVIKMLCGMYRRKKFILSLYKAAEIKKYKIQGLKNPYRSFITSKNPCTFTLAADGEEYDCIMISTLNFKTPLFFTSPTDAYFLHRLGSKNHNFSIRNNIEFYHTGTGKRIIIVNPSPKDVFAEENKDIKRVRCGDKIWNIGVHDADSFIGCMDRDCL